MASNAIAGRMNLSEKTIRRRMQRLSEQRGLRMVPVFTGEYTAACAHGYLGLVVDARRINRVAERLRAMPEIRTVAYTDGVFDLIIEVVTDSSKRMTQLVNATARLSGVHRVDHCTVRHVAKTVLDRHLATSPMNQGAPLPPKAKPKATNGALNLGMPVVCRYRDGG